MKKQIILLAAGLVLLYSNTLFAQAGTLDKSFNKSGKAITKFNGSYAECYSAAIQKNGKIVVAGSSGFADGEGDDNIDFALARYNADGTLDNTFDENSRVITDFGGLESAQSVAIQADEKIVAAGSTWHGSEHDIALARYNTDGSLDKTFGGDGKVAKGFQGDDYGTSVAIQKNGKIVVGGYRVSDDGVDFLVARYYANGNLDESFSTDGWATLPYSGSDEYCNSIAIQSDGKIVLAGYADNGFDVDFALARFNTDGTLDLSFGYLVTTGFGHNDYGESVAIQPNDGKIVVAGYSDDGSDADIALARYNINGVLDNTFEGNGQVIKGFGQSEKINSVAIQKDGKIVVGGHSFYGQEVDFLVARFQTSGSLDNTFNGNGRTITTLGYWDHCNSIAIQPDGKIVVAGTSYYTSVFGGYYADFAIARYHGDNAAPFTKSKSSEANKLDVENFSSIRIYPNPVTDILYVQGLNASATTTVLITDVSGVALQKATVKSMEHSFNVSSLQAGVYNITVTANEKTTTLKFIKR